MISLALCIYFCLFSKISTDKPEWLFGMPLSCSNLSNGFLKKIKSKVLSIIHKVLGDLVQD